jgi:hypothetical protein
MMSPSQQSARSSRFLRGARLPSREVFGTSFLGTELKGPASRRTLREWLIRLGALLPRKRLIGAEPLGGEQAPLRAYYRRMIA